jgi:hypothetical protein
MDRKIENNLSIYRSIPNEEVTAKSIGDRRCSSRNGATNANSVEHRSIRRDKAPHEAFALAELGARVMFVAA